MSQEDEKNIPEVFRDSGTGQSYFSSCVICGAKIMSAQDSVAGIVCTNEACRRDVPREWENMADELKDAKESLEETAAEMVKMEEALRFIHKCLKWQKDKKGKSVGIVKLSESKVHDIEEVLF